MSRYSSISLPATMPPAATTLEEVCDLFRYDDTGADRVDWHVNFADPAPRVVVHTGQWGTGAFGGDRVLMALLQIVAASLAGIDHLVYYTVDMVGAEPLLAGARLAAELAVPGRPTAAVIEDVVALGLRWGVSDGN